MRNSIMAELPQIPYVMDQVSDALDWAEGIMTESKFEHTLRVTLDVAKYVKSISDPNFFKTHLVVGSILAKIPNVLKEEKFARFDTASKAVEKAVEALVEPESEVEKRGPFKSLAIHLIPLAQAKEEYFILELIEIKHNLKEILDGMKPVNVKTPITPKDYIYLLGIALVMANMRMANLKFSNEAYKVYNEIEIMLNNDFNY